MTSCIIVVIYFISAAMYIDIKTSDDCAMYDVLKTFNCTFIFDQMFSGHNKTALL